MFKRIFDISLSFIGLIILLPFFIIIALIVVLDSKGSPIYVQDRVGQYNKNFKIYKFRTMLQDADKEGDLTLGDDDWRITKFGYYLRKYKIDEFPQLLNVFIGNMSFVGPRPEIRAYVDFYSEEDLEILKIKPGVTGFASIKYVNETKILKEAEDPEKFYIEKIMPDKINMNKKYMKNGNILTDIIIIFKTMTALFSRIK